MLIHLVDKIEIVAADLHKGDRRAKMLAQFRITYVAGQSLRIMWFPCGDRISVFAIIFFQFGKHSGCKPFVDHVVRQRAKVLSGALHRSCVIV